MAQSDEAPPAPAPAEPTTAERCGTLRAAALENAKGVVAALEAVGPFTDATRGLSLLERELANTGELIHLARQRLEALT